MSGEDAICELPVFTTISPTSAPTDKLGYCYGEDLKSNDRCNSATDRAKCEMTTTEMPTTEKLSCCDSDSAPMLGMCNGDAQQVRALELVPLGAGRGRICELPG